MDKRYIRPDGCLQLDVEPTKTDMERERLIQIVIWQQQEIFLNKHSLVNEVFNTKLMDVLREHPGDRNSLHEAWGLIREEFLELEDELRKKTPRYRDIADEAYDVMITCARLIAFCNDRLPQEFLPDLKNKDGQYPGHEDHF